MGLLDGTGAYGSGMTPQQMGLQDNWGLSGQTTPFPMQPYIVKQQSGVPGPPGVPGANGGQQQGGGFMSGLPQGTGTNGQTNGFSNMLQQFMGGGGGGAPSGADGMGSMGMTPADIGAGSIAGGAGGGAAGGAATDAVAGDAAAAFWIVCTELERQKRLPTKHWIAGARTFAAYPDRVKRGYYIFAIPAVRHLRKHPTSRLSRFLEWTFRARAETLAANLGVAGAKRTALGWIVLHALPPIGHVIGAFVREMPDFRVVYEPESQ